MLNIELDILNQCKDGCVINQGNEQILDEYRMIGIVKYRYGDDSVKAYLTELGERYLFDKSLDNCIIYKVINTVL